FIIVRDDRSKPDLTDVQKLRAESAAYKKYMIERYGEDAIVNFDVERWLVDYDPINIDMPVEKFNLACEENGWEPVKTY
ncbi:hypothetical protein, partial [Bacillus sp. SIMBA_005]|uniref:hypothetical protein n=1 Tax=Bacillus sp. SIMBA_005 TaxID=3085754 RepID=UPI0039785DA9